MFRIGNIAVVGGIVAAGLLSACTAHGSPIPSPTPTAPATVAPRGGAHSRPPLPSKNTALGAAMRLEITEDVSPSGRYQRDLFGPSWTDTDHNGCDQRNDVLRRDLRKRHTKPGTKGCVLAKGTLVSPYSGDKLEWVKGQTSIQIDHIVSLHDAFNTGMHDATPQERAAFANDPLNLAAVDTDENQEKSDKTIDAYAPDWEPSVRCQFARRQVSIKAKYGLTVSAAEREKFLTILGSSNYCPGDKLDLVKSNDYRIKFPAPRPIGE